MGIFASLLSRFPIYKWHAFKGYFWPQYSVISFSELLDKKYCLTPMLNVSWYCKWKWKSLSRVRLCGPMDYTVHGILQARVLEWVAIPFSRGSSQPRDQTQVSHIASRPFISWATREALESLKEETKQKSHWKSLWGQVIPVSIPSVNTAPVTGIRLQCGFSTLGGKCVLWTLCGMYIIFNIHLEVM